ncbi:tripartite tricarboxylate transporter TctB family protein [Deinococcus koreensis]|uniref:DUF1468 domain-containing protein n=1 Tax=Deinococcus koreensis TaxID=2054903 RepID=A0A2K3V103_9DEIO|nr:tripartite tricarboxylate transporter TctB family protein [Deinococcus koreensis]PNY82456.1 hypothetical protein CVO96_14855 [Deinococcus koreensis]
MSDPSRPSPPDPPRAPSVPDLLMALGVTLLGALLLYGTLRIPPGTDAVVGPRVFPLTVSLGTLALGTWLAVLTLRGERAGPAGAPDTSPDAPADLKAPGLILGGFLLGMVLIPPLGFVPGTALMAFCVALALGERRWALMVGVALLLAVLIFLVFTRGLGLSLPAGVLGGLL